MGERTREGGGKKGKRRRGSTPRKIKIFYFYNIKILQIFIIFLCYINII